MYSVLLVAALTAGTAEMPAWHGCHGCHGCWGGNAFSSCYGCSGCYGCCGGCWGCYGCSGCYGCWGCGGGCYGAYYGQCYGCSGCYGCCGGCYGCSGCYGCYGCGGGVVVGSTVVTPGTVLPAGTIVAPTKEKKKKDKDDDDEATLGQAATVIVSLPADAALYVDGMKANLTSDVRTFQTPALTVGQDYVYTIKVEAVRDGEAVSESRRVLVRGGKTTRVTFGELTAKADTAPARVTVKLPAEAKLYVDGVLCPQTSATRSFETPKLEAGKTYSYTLKAEMVRDGQTVSDSKTVKMTAGKEVKVDFTDVLSVVAR